MNSLVLKIFLDIDNQYLADVTVSLDDSIQKFFSDIVKLSPIRNHPGTPSLLFSKFTATHKKRADGVMIKMIPFGPYLKVLSSDNLTMREILEKMPSTWRPDQHKYGGFFEITPIDWIKVSIY